MILQYDIDPRMIPLTFGEACRLVRRSPGPSAAGAPEGC